MTCIETILDAAHRKAGPTIFGVWNAVVIYIPEESRLQAAERLADTMAHGWREWL